MADFYRSESQYVEYLDYTLRTFAAPLAKTHDLKEVTMLFSNIPDLLAFHRSHLKLLLQFVLAESSNAETPSIGKLVLNMVQGFDLYTMYALGYLDSLAILNKYQVTPGVRELLKVIKVTNLIDLS